MAFRKERFLGENSSMDLMNRSNDFLRRHSFQTHVFHLRLTIADTEEASESEYGRAGRDTDEPLEIKEQ